MKNIKNYTSKSPPKRTTWIPIPHFHAKGKPPLITPATQPPALCTSPPWALGQGLWAQFKYAKLPLCSDFLIS